MGGYDETAAQFAENVRDFATGGLINLIGGCCGTTPAHIKAVADIVSFWILFVLCLVSLFPIFSLRHGNSIQHQMMVAQGW